MSPKIQIPPLAAGLLCAFGLVGSATLRAAGPQGPADAAPAAIAPAPAAPKAADRASAPSGPPTVLLLTNGKVLQGEILKDASGYVLKHKVGVMHFPRRNVERTFDSVDEVYAYKLALCPENDPDERLKLATWCLEQHMKPEAKAQLEAALELAPKDRRARAMLANLERNSAAPHSRDDGVERASVEIADRDREPETGLGRLREEFSRNPRAAGTPRVLDLDPPLAVRRYQEFARFVHPVLQRRCAQCHNEQSPTDFRLVQTRARRDMANDLIVRTNLDATLRIVNPDDLARSAVLSASGMTHGAGGKPVLGGPHSPEYRVLATWVNSLKSGSTPAPPPLASPAASSATPPGEGFAAGRFAPKVDPAMPPAARPVPRLPGMASLPPEVPEEDRTEFNTTPLGSGSLIPGSGDGLPNNPPPPSDFQVPRYRPRTDAASAPDVPRDSVTGEPLPVVTKEMTQRKKDEPGKKTFNPKVLDKFMKAKTSKAK